MKTQSRVGGVLTAVALAVTFLGTLSSAFAAEGLEQGAIEKDEVGAFLSLEEDSPQTQFMNGMIRMTGYDYYRDHVDENASIIVEITDLISGKRVDEGSGPYQAAGILPPGSGPDVPENHGFTIVIPITAGDYEVCVSGGASGEIFGCRDVIVHDYSAAISLVGNENFKANGTPMWWPVRF